MEDVHNKLIAELDILIDTDQAERAALITVLAFYKDRIFIEGKDANGRITRSYTKKYLKIRAKNNRGSGDKKVFSLTRQLENDLTLLADSLSFGCNNPHNYDKTQWLQAMEGVEIFDNLTSEELDLLITVFDFEIKKRLK